MFVIRFPLGVITVADPGFTNGEQGRGAAGAERSGVWGGEDPSPLRRAWGEGDAPPPKKKSILDLKVATLGAFCALFLQFTYLV